MFSKMQKITPFLWFDGQAEEAVAFYLSVFKDGKIHATAGKVWDWLRDDDPARVQRVTAALWQMEKLDLAELERAAAGSS